MGRCRRRFANCPDELEAESSYGFPRPNWGVFPQNPLRRMTWTAVTTSSPNQFESGGLPNFGEKPPMACDLAQRFRLQERQSFDP